jgi:thiamine pyrophosphokinase
MRGAAFIGGEGPDPDLGKRALGKVDLVVAADSGLIAAEEWGLESDWIVGDMDSIDDTGRLARYPADRVLSYPTDKDYTDTELALALLREKGCDEIVLVGGGGGRLDHTLAIVALFERECTPKRWITAREDIRFLSAELAGKTSESEGGALLRASVQAGSLVSIFPIGSGPWKALSEGLKWPLDELPWRRGFFGISNIATEGTFSVHARSGRFFAVLPLA